ncbi:hypothetical protein LCL95_01255 [Bacillus timonensis]|nr:hypothetical protein [Bacillus timonensis]
MIKKGVTIIISLVMLLLIVMFFVDYRLAVHQKPPFFAIKTAIYKDGGTQEYIGFGYKILDYNSLDGRDDVVFISAIVCVGEK